MEHSELLLDPGPLSTPFAGLRPLIAQLHFSMFLGIAEGAFEEARNYTLKEGAVRGSVPAPARAVKTPMCCVTTASSGSAWKACAC